MNGSRIRRVFILLHSGASQELYIVDIPEEFLGRPYAELVYGIYDKFGSIVIGLDQGGKRDSLLKPRSDYQVTSGIILYLID